MTETTITAIVSAASGVLLAAIGSYHAIKLAQLKDHINSRMDEMLKLVKAEAHAVGKLEGKAEQKAENRVELLTQAAIQQPIPVAKPETSVKVETI